jgi:hypothetical protein
MDNRFKYIFLSFSLFLFLIGIMIWYANTYSTFRPVEREFSIDTREQITRIEIENPHHNIGILLEPDENNRWRLNSTQYANESAVMEFLGHLRRLTIRQPVSIEESEQVHQRFVDYGIRTTVFIRDYHIRIAKRRFFPYERIHQSFLVAGDTPDGQATYMKKVNSTVSFHVHVPGYEQGLYPFFNAGINTWRDPVIVDVAIDDLEQVKVHFPLNPRDSYSLNILPNRNFAFFDINNIREIENLTVDTLRVMRFLSSFQGLHYELLPHQELVTQQRFEQPFIELSIRSTHGEVIELVAFRKMPDPEQNQGSVDFDPNRFFIQLPDGSFAQAQYYVFSRIFRPLSFFVKDR